MLTRRAAQRTGGVTSLADVVKRIEQWTTYLNNVVPARVAELKRDGAQAKWPHNAEYDVIVVGFGAAGASAALDAADAGKRVLLIDRFDGGGSTRRSGGIYYAGAGTRAQREAGVEDSVEQMFRYLKKENDGAVDDSVIMRFCAESPSTFSWLEGRVGVPFRSARGATEYYDVKTSYPPDPTTLYNSGNELAHPYSTIAAPAARGNRPFGEYLTGNILYNAFERAVAAHALITVAMHCKAADVVLDTQGRVSGLDVDALLDERAQSVHVMLHEIGSGAPMLDSSRKTDRLCATRESELLAAAGVRVRLNARAVVLCTGGFLFNRDMVRQYAPKYESFMPLGNLGDDGSGVAMAQRAGAKLSRMDRCSAWKFINPPLSFVSGVLVNAQGERVGNEDCYGATLADFLIQKHDGKGWLVIDQAMWDQANADCMDPASGLQPDQRMQGLANLHKNNVKADALDELAAKLNAPQLSRTLSEYNANAIQGKDPVFHKVGKFVHALSEPPFYAINMSMTGNKYWATPCMSLGGVCVDGVSGQVLREAGGVIQGLYTAGRTSVGVASNYYVSGLSLGDCVFTGRRAGRHIAKL